MSGLQKPDNQNFEQTVSYVFQQAIKAEYKSRYLYVKLSNMFNHIPEISSFWTELAQDEEYHAKELENIREALTNEQLTQTADRELLVNINKVLMFLKEIQFDHIKTLDDGYEIAHELEYSEINSVFKILATEFVFEEKRREVTISQLGYHLEKLMTFNENFGDRTWRKGIIAQHLVHQT